MILFRGEVLSLKTSADGHVRCRRCMSSDICISWPRDRGVLDLEGDFHLENFRSLNPQSPQQSRQLLHPGRNFRYLQLSEPRGAYSVISKA